MSLPDAQRAAFLAWASDRWRADAYRHISETSGEWDAWQAALASQAAEVEALRADSERLQKAWDASFAQAMANGERSISQAAELQSLRDAIANDSLACTYQTLGQYRTMLLAAVDSLLRKD